MGLDLGRTALQIDRMADEVSARQSDYGERLRRALDTLRNFDTHGYLDKLGRSRSTLAWNLPEPMDDPGARYSPPDLPADYRVVAVDGSHIDVDRHLAARCFLINIGVAALTYGSAPDADLYSRPRLYAGDEELAIRDPASGREEQIQGAVLGAKRAVEELGALADAVRDLPPETPTLALMDGTLVMMGIGLLRYGNRRFVLKHLVEDGFARALAELREMARQRPLAVASYVSLPNSAEVANATRLLACPYDVAACEARCGGLPARERPCDVAVGGLRDRHLFAQMLAKGERSAVFRGSYRMVDDHYDGQDVCFFYVNTGEEIGRVEVPSWVAEDEAALGLAHAMIVDQCGKGPGYPTVLMEAHEQAVVTGPDRRLFTELVENALQDRGLPVYTSEKNRTKRLRWV